MSLIDKDNRFAHLLEPIRDLAKNWNIDIATELEDYLGELEDITVSFDNGATTLNFAEAALLIQGSACVYSKKVEYLYSLLYQTLDVLIEKRKKQQSSVNAQGKDTDLVFSADPEFLPLDDIIKESENIDLKDDDDYHDYHAERKSTLNPRAPVSLLSASHDQEEKSSNYRISNCVVHPSGALLLEDRDADLIDSDLRLSVSPQGPMPFGSPQVEMKSQAAEEPSEEDPTRVLEYEELGDAQAMDMGMDMPMSADDDSDDDGAGMDHKHNGPEDQAPAVDFSDDPDPWAMLDPHEEDKTRPEKPVKKGRTFREPKLTSSGLRDMELKLPLFEASHPTSTVITRIRAGSSKQLPYFEEFADVFVEQRKKRRRALKLQRQRRQQQRRAAQALVLANDADDDDDDDFDDGGFMADDAMMDGVEPPEVEVNLGDMEASSSSSQRYGGSGAELAPAAMLQGDAAQSYEQLCQEHLNAYFEAAKKYATETQLSKRVSDWQSRLEPVLAAEEERGAFDIHEVGADLLTKMGSEIDEKDPDGMLVGFSTAVANQERYQVCRSFLAMLQLANNGNVDIVPEESSSKRSAIDEELDRNVFFLKVLSLEPKLPDMGHYQAPSLADKSRGGKSSSSRLPLRAKKARALHRVNSLGASDTSDTEEDEDDFIASEEEEEEVDEEEDMSSEDEEEEKKSTPPPSENKPRKNKRGSSTAKAAAAKRAKSSKVVVSPVRKTRRNNNKRSTVSPAVDSASKSRVHRARRGRTKKTKTNAKGKKSVSFAAGV